MKVGFKTGPKTWEEGQTLIREHGARYVEIWYRYDWAERYTEMFQTLRQEKVQFGLHYWGLVGSNLQPSFCHDEPEQYQLGLASVKQSIDVAGQVGAYYVNVHPGSRILTHLSDDYNYWTAVDRPITSLERAAELLLKATAELHDYAKERGVLLLMETLPAYDLADQSTVHTAKREILKSHYPPVDFMLMLAQHGYYIANDFCHTAMNRPTEDRQLLWQQLWQASQDLAPQTKLVHINTVTEPFEGVDTHDGILPSDWAKDVFPDEAQFKQLLALFADRQDVWAIPEPRDGQMIPNYLALTAYANQV